MKATKSSLAPPFLCAWDIDKSCPGFPALIFCDCWTLKNSMKEIRSVTATARAGRKKSFSNKKN
jgi:hypothetical protein